MSLKQPYTVITIMLCSLLGGVNALAQESGYEAACTSECSFLTNDCTAYLECKIAKSTCISNCMQRKVWEKVALSLDKLTAVLEKQAREKEEEQRSETKKDEKVPQSKEKTENMSQGY